MRRTAAFLLAAAGLLGLSTVAECKVIGRKDGVAAASVFADGASATGTGSSAQPVQPATGTSSGDIPASGNVTAAAEAPVAYTDEVFYPDPVSIDPLVPLQRMPFVTAAAPLDIPSIPIESVEVNPKRCWQQLPHGVLEFLPDNRYSFPELLNKLGLTGYAAELGVLEAQYSAAFLSKWKGKKLFLVDPWESQDRHSYNDINNRNSSEFDRLVARVEATLSPFAGRFAAVRRYSFDAASLFPDHSLDFVFIDANHSYEAVKRDLEDWWPKLRVGGMMAGHDFIADGFYQEGTFGVRGAVLEFCRARCIMPHNTMRRDDHGVPNFYFFKPHPM